MTEPLVDGPTEGRACRSAEDQGRLADAESACQRAVDVARRSYTPIAKEAAPVEGGARKGPDTGAQTYSMRLYNLARIKRKLGRHAEAEALYRRSLEIEEGVSGSHSTWVGRRLIELAIVQGQQGRWVDGGRTLERALPIASRLPAAERATTARVTARFVAALREARQDALAGRLERAAAGLG